jgi:hypothetical protein
MRTSPARWRITLATAALAANSVVSVLVGVTGDARQPSTKAPFDQIGIQPFQVQEQAHFGEGILASRMMAWSGFRS